MRKQQTLTIINSYVAQFHEQAVEFHAFNTTDLKDVQEQNGDARVILDRATEAFNRMAELRSNIMTRMGLNATLGILGWDLVDEARTLLTSIQNNPTASYEYLS